MSRRLHPKIVVTRRARYQGERQPGVKLELIVVHTTEGHNRPGPSDLENLGTWFADKRSRASAHVGTDADGTSGRYVADEMKAWACGRFNSASLNLEQIGKAADTRAAWEARSDELWESARWIARWSLKHDIPIRKGSVRSDGTVVRSGVVRHSELGRLGGNHSDPGDSFPLDLLMDRARQIRAALKGDKPVEPGPKPKPKPRPKPKPKYPGRPLKRGSRGEAVKTWQRRLRVTVDGEFGPGTEAATRRFQRSKKLTADGIAGPRTWDAAF